MSTTTAPSRTYRVKLTFEVDGKRRQRTVTVDQAVSKSDARSTARAEAAIHLAELGPVVHAFATHAPHLAATPEITPEPKATGKGSRGGDPAKALRWEVAELATELEGFAPRSADFWGAYKATRYMTPDELEYLRQRYANLLATVEAEEAELEGLLVPEGELLPSATRRTAAELARRAQILQAVKLA